MSIHPALQTPSDIQRELAARAKARRLELNITQAELAERSGVSFGSLRRFEATGEISLRGKVLAIGGLKEKTMAAYSAGIRTVLIPSDNMRDFDELDDAVKKEIRFIPCNTLGDILKNALSQRTPNTAKKSAEASEEFPHIIASSTASHVSIRASR